jgi:heptosyltransferase III
MTDRGPELLLIGLGGLGDLLVLQPAIAWLRRTRSDRRMTLLCRGEYGRLFLDSRVVDRILPLEARAAASLFGNYPVHDPEAFRPTGELEAVVVWARKGLDRSVRTGLEILCPGRLHVIVPGPGSVAPFSRSFYERTRKAFPFGAGGGPDFDECALLQISEKTRIETRTATGLEGSGHDGYAIVHPGSGGESKCWPLSNYLEIIGRLDGLGIPGALVTGEAEERPGIAGRLESEPLPETWRWIRRPALERLSGLLAGACFYLGNDSGVTHLAAACGTRGLALFRDEGLPAWTPVGKMGVLSAAEPVEIGIEQVWEKLATFFLQSKSTLL